MAGLTDGVLRMFWMKKMAAGLVLVGLGGRRVVRRVGGPIR